MLRFEPRIERGKSLPVTLEYYKQLNGQKYLVDCQTRDFSLNYFTRSRKKVSA